MEEITYHAKVVSVHEDGSMIVSPIPFSKDDYQGEMYLHTRETKIYDRFGDYIDSSYFKKNQWVKFVFNGVMTMSLPPQLNPTILYEHVPLIEFEAKILKLNHQITLQVTNNLGSFVSGVLELSFFDEPIIFNDANTALTTQDLQISDTIHVFSIVSFFENKPLIELYRIEKISKSH